MKLKTFSNKKGFTLVEAITSVIVFVLFATAFLTTVMFSVKQISDAGRRTEALSTANGIVETAIRSISSGTVTLSEIENLTRAKYMASDFVYNSNNKKQFKISSITENGITVYEISVAVYFGNEGDKVLLYGSAVDTGSNFLN